MGGKSGIMYSVTFRISKVYEHVSKTRRMVLRLDLMIIAAIICMSGYEY